MKKAFFLSDLHLGSRCLSDVREAERRAVAFLESIREEAGVIYLLGDVIDYWFEYRHVVPRGYVRFFGKLAELSDAGVRIVWMRGNHDTWIFDYLPSELGIEVCDGPAIRLIMGKRFFLDHGDAVGWQPRPYRVLRKLFRNRLCQKMFSAVHPRWTVPLAYGWSRSNRGSHPVAAPYAGPHDEPLMRFASEYVAAHPDSHIDYFIFGHRHILVEEQIAPATKAVILGEWISLCSYAVFDGEQLILKQYRTNP